MRVEYPWHAAAGVEVEVLYREQRRGEVVFICRMPDGTGEVVPAWMFDGAECSRLKVGPPRASVKALAELRARLDGICSDPGKVAEIARRQEVPDEEQDAVQRASATETTVPTAAVSEHNRERQSRSGRRRHCAGTAALGGGKGDRPKGGRR